MQLLSNQIPRSSAHKIGHNFFQRRHSRSSVEKHKSLSRLRRTFLPDRSDSKRATVPALETTNSLIDPNTGQYKTSITVDILGNETFPRLTEWRKTHLIEKTRRLLPLPVSLTGLGDGDMPRFWTQLMRKTSLQMNDKHKMSELSLYEKIPVSLRTYLDHFGDRVKHEWPELYESYIKSKQLSDNNKSEAKSDTNFQLPYELVSQMKTNQKSLKTDESTEETEIESKKPRHASGLIDTEYDNFLKHHHLIQHFAASLKGIKTDEYEGEIEGWADQMWRRNYGTPDPRIKPSNVQCGGCGAHLHCTAANIPGYIPSELFKNLNEEELREERCQRCQYLSHFNVALNVTVKSDQYPELIAHIQNKRALIVILVDMLDFPCSVWPGIVNLIGKDHKIYIVGNKADLLPKDDNYYLERAVVSLKKSLQAIGIDRNTRVRDVSLISAKTGWGVEDLVTRLLRDRQTGEDIYLIGCTNSGKSTLFNSLMQSDLCKIRDVDLVNRATTSVWPGTTLNLLKFPVFEPTGWQLQLRLNRLKVVERRDIKENILKRMLYKKTGDIRYATLSQRIGNAYPSEVPINVQTEHPLARKRQHSRPFDSKHFSDSDFVCDTPGTIYKDQILSLLTTEELLKTIPREIITPRTFSLRPLQSLFIGGLARIDLTHSRQHVWLTVFASHYLPIHVVHTEEAHRFYETYLGTDLLGVPIGGAARLDRWPKLVPKEVTLDGLNWNESCADIVLSTAGWVAITFGPDTKSVLRAFTPEGRGIYVRTPPLLPYAINLRGKRILNTPCFENKLFTVDDLFYPRKDSKENILNESRRSAHISQKRFNAIKQ